MTDSAESTVDTEAFHAKGSADEIRDADLEQVVGGLARAWPVHDAIASGDSDTVAIAGAGA